jgi:hypothetical protein
MEVYKAINRVQMELSKVGISKDRTNSQGAGYKFRGIDDVYNAVSPLLATNGLCILPRMISRQCDERLSKSGGALFYVTVEAEFDFVSAQDGSKHTVKTFGEAMDSGDKATNKAMSAAYKYAAFQAFAIPTEGDNDADSATHEIQAKQRPLEKAHKPVDGAMESLSPERQDHAKGLAIEIIANSAKGDMHGAADIMESIKDGDEKIAVWSLLDSRIRSALKKVAEERKVAA